MVENIVVGEEHAVGEPVVADELPDVLDRVEFRALRGQWHEREVGRYGELVRQVPSRLVKEQYGVTARRDGRGDLGQVQGLDRRTRSPVAGPDVERGRPHRPISAPLPPTSSAPSVPRSARGQRSCCPDAIPSR
jgi:hypothetical protein